MTAAASLRSRWSAAISRLSNASSPTRRFKPRRQPAQQHLLIARSDVEAGANCQGYEGIDDGGHRRPGQTEPEGREGHGKQRESRIVGHEDVAVEPGPDGDAGRGQGDVQGAEEQHPPPRDRPVRQEPEVDQAIERHQRDHQEHLQPDVGVREARPVGYLEGRDQCDEPATPDRNPRGIGHNIGLGPYRRLGPTLQRAAEGGQDHGL